MTSINYQNTWHSKESDLNYGPGTPSYYQAKFSHALNDKKSLVYTRRLKTIQSPRNW